MSLSLNHLELADVTGRVDLVDGLRLAPQRTDVLFCPTGIHHRQVGTLTGQAIDVSEELKYS